MQKRLPPATLPAGNTRSVYVATRPLPSCVQQNFSVVLRHASDAPPLACRHVPCGAVPEDPAPPRARARTDARTHNRGGSGVSRATAGGDAT